MRRAVDPEDGRACLLSLTGKGAATLKELRREGDSGLAADLRALGAGQRRLLADALPVLVELADLHGVRPPTDNDA